MKRVICKSGLQGYQEKLRTAYSNFAEFKAYSDTYGLATQLGYKTPEAAWKANPTIQGSIEPSDFRKVKAKPKKAKTPKTPQKCPACKHYSCICQPVDDLQELAS